MSDTWLISDTHFNHQNAYKFTKADGSPLRHPYTCAEEGDAAMIENWNKVVKPEDKVYHLGDVAMNKKGLALVKELNGTKVLIKGNHDQEKLCKYVDLFKDVRGSHQLAGMLLTHIPVHVNSLARWGVNVHGHLHSNVVTRPNISSNPNDPLEMPDNRYICVSVEQINFTPIHLDEVIKIMTDRGLSPNYRKNGYD